jgi:hypothetical protein
MNFKLQAENKTSLLQSERNGRHGPTKAYKQATIHNADKTLPCPHELSFRIA